MSACFFWQKSNECQICMFEMGKPFMKKIYYPVLKNAHSKQELMVRNSYFYIEKWTFKIMCEVCYRAKRDKKEAT